MLVSSQQLLAQAVAGGYAIGAFNIYNLEGVRAVIAAAEAEHSPVMLQLHPAALKHGGAGFVALCLRSGQEAIVPISIHLDHSTSAEAIQAAIQAGITSIMADGSHLSYAENIAFTRQMSQLAHSHHGFVEAELGRLTGTEDGLTVDEYEAKFTDPAQAADFVQETQIDALAVCIGNVHGRYPGEPKLDFPRLAAIRQQVAVPLVLHGASGLPESMVKESIQLGVCKFNVNTEVRAAYIDALRSSLAEPKTPDLVDLMGRAISAMQAVIVGKLRLFGSIGAA